MFENEPVLAIDEIQANILRGFGSRYLHLAGYKMDQPEAAKPWIAALADRLSTVSQVHQHRLLRSRDFAEVSRVVLLNAALSFKGLELLGVDVTRVADGLFRKPMGRVLGDLRANNEPTDYAIGRTLDDTPDILFLLGSDDSQFLTQVQNDLRQEAETVGLRHIYACDGSELPGKTEHFGFRDGISQPGPRGRLSTEPDDVLTLRYIDSTDKRAALFAKPGQPLVWPGQFVFGYPTQLPNCPLRPGPCSDGGAPWMANGSFLVFRQLRQDVRAFRKFLQEASVQLSAATGDSYTAQQVGAMLVGRWEDGTPLTLSPGANNPAIAEDEMWVNHFAFLHGTNEIQVTDRAGAARTIPGHPEDDAGLRCPLFAHIRKVNPRDKDTELGDPGSSLTLQMLRRGIPYGPPVVEGENEEEDRGLLFLAYQTSFDRQFKFIHDWMNHPSLPEGDSGHDMLIGQPSNDASRFCKVRDKAGKELTPLRTRARWVIPTGGAFMFSPSVSFFRQLDQS